MNSLVLACGACQMVQLHWLSPGFPAVLLAVIPAFAAYLVAIGLEGARLSRIVGLIVIFGLSFVFGGMTLPILVFPLVIILLPLLLIAKLASRSRGARVAAVVGLLPLIVVLVKLKWEASQSGPFYRLDRVPLREDFVQRLGSNLVPELSQEQLLDALVEGPERRRENAALILKVRLREARDVERLEATLNSIQAMRGSAADDRLIELEEAYEEAITRLNESGLEDVVPGKLPIQGPASRRIRTH